MTARRKLSEARRIQILEAAVGVIGARGLCDTRIADIAERAGTSSALVLYYFGSKDRLLAEALAFSDERFYAQVFHELSQIEGARDQLVRVIELSCPRDRRSAENSLDDWVLWLELWSRAPRDAEVAKGRQALDRKWHTAIGDVVRLGQERGEFKAGVDPEDFGIRLAALVDGLAVLVVLNHPGIDATRMREMCLRTAAVELGFELPTAHRGRARSARRPIAEASDAAAAAPAGKRVAGKAT